jgi:hypothetical protein
MTYRKLHCEINYASSNLQQLISDLSSKCAPPSLGCRHYSCSGTVHEALELVYLGTYGFVAKHYRPVKRKRMP